MEKLPITKEGYARLEDEFKTLKFTERPAVIESIAEAREHGDLKENAEYHAAREKQSFIEGRIKDLEDKIARAEIIDISQITGNTVKFGAKIDLIDCESEKELSYQIVGEYEANTDVGKISVKAPISRVLIGKEEGDEVVVNSPGGKKTYEILSVKYN